MPDVFALARNGLLAMSGLLWSSFQSPPHLVTLARKLEAVERGDIKRLMIFMPPRHGKTQLGSIFFLSWYMGRNPEKNIIFSTYQQDKANDVGQAIQGFMNEPKYLKIFPEFEMSTTTHSKSHILTTADGNFYAVGAGGAITGRGGDIFLIDDPVKGRKEANSKAFQHAFQEWYKATAYTRLEPNGSIIVIQTRWGELDPAGWMLSAFPDEKWDVVEMPALDEADHALWPERYPTERLYEIRNVLGEFEFQSLYQQRPVARTGNILKREWWRRYTELPTEFDVVIQSWDMSFKDGDKNDYVVGQVWGRKGVKCHLIDQIRGRMGFKATVNAFLAMTEKHPDASIKLIEDKANGSAVIDTLSDKISGIVPVNPKGSKQERAEVVAYVVEGGDVYLPANEPWVEGYIDEHAAFPNGAYDDQVDATTQALSRLGLNSNAHALMSSEVAEFMISRPTEMEIEPERGSEYVACICRHSARVTTPIGAIIVKVDREDLDALGCPRMRIVRVIQYSIEQFELLFKHVEKFKPSRIVVDSRGDMVKIATYFSKRIRRVEKYAVNSTGESDDTYKLISMLKEKRILIHADNGDAGRMELVSQLQGARWSEAGTDKIKLSVPIEGLRFELIQAMSFLSHCIKKPFKRQTW